MVVTISLLYTTILRLWALCNCIFKRKKAFDMKSNGFCLVIASFPSLPHMLPRTYHQLTQNSTGYFSILVVCKSYEVWNLWCSKFYSRPPIHIITWFNYLLVWDSACYVRVASRSPLVQLAKQRDANLLLWMNGILVIAIYKYCSHHCAYFQLHPIDSVVWCYFHHW